ncbi:hypothetical protein RUND412_001343 [Rhizina undulata]
MFEDEELLDILGEIFKKRAAEIADHMHNLIPREHQALATAIFSRAWMKPKDNYSGYPTKARKQSSILSILGSRANALRLQDGGFGRAGSRNFLALFTSVEASDFFCFRWSP